MRELEKVRKNRKKGSLPALIGQRVDPEFRVHLGFKSEPRRPSNQYPGPNHIRLNEKLSIMEPALSSAR